jgi:hypothetical protein
MRTDGPTTDGDILIGAPLKCIDLQSKKYNLQSMYRHFVVSDWVINT